MYACYCTRTTLYARAERVRKVRACVLHFENAVHTHALWLYDGSPATRTTSTQSPASVDSPPTRSYCFLVPTRQPCFRALNHFCALNHFLRSTLNAPSSKNVSSALENSCILRRALQIAMDWTRSLQSLSQRIFAIHAPLPLTHTAIPPRQHHPPHCHACCTPAAAALRICCRGFTFSLQASISGNLNTTQSCFIFKCSPNFR